ncbi:high-affinity branched-chain amino acid ABC transporter ATP-binding protein LivF [Gottschalkia acidurici 9a]|uniref:High-affinity branched-chain amino acid ABC transporter ATP-binding protein LivF n=1 Tax=Gottschalkia acidurici (strain ATCC 7906 / DSM 604 / BCRC 14475 / CIP 104303 / KCTC 5404 / NCIMB 10678 / 9a) TaxID=1128398 RepID=K0B1S8_GOTA9|nr:ABC transporter ATP-binding protein [Gottschalkia acidurici]AFS79409.1 high-affinity branched-chain amino acid ABC transporter ATP-binding protein LivF [Gottschalkia acidurici 9a]
MLKIDDLHVYYGGIHALKGISFEVKEGQIVTLIGSNGAGKTTTLRSISNLVKGKGSIKYNGEEIIGKASEKIVKDALIHVPEGRRVFTALNVEENLFMGAYLRNDTDGIQKDLTYVYKLFPRLKERAKQMAGTLSGGEQQMLAIGRAIMSKPKLLMLDEPSMGLAPIVVSEIFEAVKELNKEGLTVLLVEQNANIALKVADKAYVIETGEIVLEGNAKDLLSDDRVRKAYLGED